MLTERTYQEKYEKIVQWLQFNHKWILTEYLKVLDFEDKEDEKPRLFFKNGRSV
jgi:hypothetical protein